MLMQLQIENVAVIERVVVDFTSGLNVLTGETGAGKSIIIDSINAVTGEKTSKDIIRTGAQKAKISAIFSEIGKEAEEQLNEIGYELSEDGLLMISREISSDGRSVFRINGNIVPMMIVKQISPFLINIHGQHDNQQLFSPSKHISFIDGFSNIEKNVEEYGELYRELCDIRQKLESIETDDALKNKKIELLSFQIDEIESANLVANEEETLLLRRDIIKNSEELAQNVVEAHELLSGDENSDGIVSMIRKVSALIENISQYDEEFVSISEKAETLSYELEEILSEIRNSDGKFLFDEQELDEIEDRLDLIYKLKQKYGNSVDDILLTLNKFKQELDEINFSKENISLLNKQFGELKEKAYKSARIISQIRIENCKILCQNIKEELKFLDMPNVSFSVSNNIVELKNDGIDQMEFLISANTGESLKPLSKIASGGELSRIMLAIKTVLSKSDKTNALIFDEIDTGVSGKTARKIGEKMKQISTDKQVLCVTHLAQIASLANNHLLIEKSTKDNRTYTTVRSLELDERIHELARIMGGDVITDTTLKAAEELIKI